MIILHGKENKVYGGREMGISKEMIKKNILFFY